MRCASVTTKNRTDSLHADCKADAWPSCVHLFYCLSGYWVGGWTARCSLCHRVCDRVLAEWYRLYKKQGLAEYIRIKQTSHRRNLSEEEEAKILAECEKEADAGQVLTAETVRRKLEERLGRETSSNYVYRVMKRNGWRKVMPRAKHPKSASREEQDSSKKLKINTTIWLPKTPARM